MSFDLSIIVPIYNVEKYLDQTVQSLLKQKEFNYEIVLVNDGSVDGCPELCKRYSDANADRVQVVNKPNGGLPSARKAGVKVARGEYITFLDGDDWIDDDYYFNMLKNAKKNNAEIVCSSFLLSYQDKKAVEYKNTISTGVYEKVELEEIKKKILCCEPYFTYGIVPSLCMKVIRKDYLEKYIYSIPNDVTMAEDALCTYPMLFACEKLVVLNDNLGYYYRQIESSMTHAYDSEKTDKIICAMDYLEEVFMPYYPKFQTQIDAYYSQLIREAVKNELINDATLNYKKEKLLSLLQKEYVIRTVNELKHIPVQYKLFFELLKRKRFVLLNAGYIIYKKLKKEW